MQRRSTREGVPVRMSPITGYPLPHSWNCRSGSTLFHHAAQKFHGLPGSPIWRQPWPSGPDPMRPAPGPTSPLGWWTGIRAWKTWWSPPPIRGTASTSRKGCSGVELGLLVQGRVLEGVLPALGELLPAAPDPVGVGDPVAGVRVADGVVEDVGGAAEDGAGHEVALLLALHHLPVPIDQGDVAGAGGRGLGRASPLMGIAARAASSSAAARSGPGG